MTELDTLEQDLWDEDEDDVFDADDFDDESDDEALEDNFLGLRLGEEVYAVQLKYVVEIIGILGITYVPEMPDYLKGVINLRGKIIPVIDIRARFGLPEKEYDELTCIIVVEVENEDEAVGLIVDVVSEVVNLPLEKRMESAELSGKAAASIFVEALGKNEENVYILLDVKKILNKSYVI